MKLLPETRWLWIGFCFLLSGAAVSAQFTIDRQVTIMPIQVRSTDGNTVGNASLELYEAVADRVWAQAGIDINFLPWETFVSDNYLNVGTQETDTYNLLNLSQLGSQPWSALGETVVKMFFVPMIGGSVSNLGYSRQSSVYEDAISGNPLPQQETAIMIANSAFSQGIIDVIAHEIGHVLGMNHTTLGAGGAANLMTDGGSKTAVTSINQITTDGLTGLDLLTGTIGGTTWGYDTGGLGPYPVPGLQIDRARIMTLAVPIAPYTYNAVPEPATTAAIAGGLVLLVAGFYRRARAR